MISSLFFDLILTVFLLFRKIILLTCTLLSVVGNVIYLMGYPMQSVAMLIAGRLVAGLGRNYVINFVKVRCVFF